jgi:3-isopropylmalate/(R)-2-methylmalate dehydratase small subunit
MSAALSSAIKTVSGRGVPVPGNDLDTDRIIPAKFMKCVTFDELGPYAFYDARFNEDGSKKDHAFNEEKFKGASILIVNANFGCGSSREHAPQSLKRYGIKAIIGESFAEIFADNCTAIGLPVVTASRDDVEKLMAQVRAEPRAEIRIDLERQEAAFGGQTIPVKQPDQMRKALTQGTWDSTAELLSAADAIRATAGRLPYPNAFKS